MLKHFYRHEQRRFVLLGALPGPQYKHDSCTLWNARIALSGDNDKWMIALIGKNLSDETTAV